MCVPCCQSSAIHPSPHPLPLSVRQSNPHFLLVLSYEVLVFKEKLKVIIKVMLIIFLCKQNKNKNIYRACKALNKHSSLKTFLWLWINNSKMFVCSKMIVVRILRAVSSFCRAFVNRSSNTVGINWYLCVVSDQQSR